MTDIKPSSRHRRLWTSFAGVLLIITSVMLIAPSASAEAKPTSTSGKYCAFNSATAVMACVDEEKDYPVAKAAALGNGGASAMRAQYLLGRFFDNAGFNTSSGFIDWFGTSSCTSSLSDTNSSWSDTTSWRDRISSFQGYSACRIKAYENASYGGASLGYVTSSSNVGILNDHVWSVRFS